jgi:putative transposase
VASLLERYADEVTDDGRPRLVRHGHLPEREIVTGIGPMEWADQGIVSNA